MTATHRTKVSGVTIDLPVYTDPQNTERLARAVSDRVSKIEDTSHRIDTQAFALAAAVSFAAELEEAHEAHRRETAEAAKALTAVIARLDKLIEAYASRDVS